MYYLAGPWWSTRWIFFKLITSFSQKRDPPLSFVGPILQAFYQSFILLGPLKKFILAILIGKLVVCFAFIP